MDHQIAEETGAVERYVLNEYSPEERAAFEAHFFDCPACAEQVRDAAVFVANAGHILRKQVKQPGMQPSQAKRGRLRFDWFRPILIAPSAIAALLAVIVGYQNLVTVPALEKPQVLSTEVIAPAARATAPVIPVDRSLPRFNMNFLVDAPRVFASYVCQLRDGRGNIVLTVGSGARDVSSFTLSLLLPAEKFPDGAYELDLVPSSDPGTPVERYTFVIQTRTPQ